MILECRVCVDKRVKFKNLKNLKNLEITFTIFKKQKLTNFCVLLYAEVDWLACGLIKGSGNRKIRF